jgi:hypothetical protein
MSGVLLIVINPSAAVPTVRARLVLSLPAVAPAGPVVVAVLLGQGTPFLTAFLPQALARRSTTTTAHPAGMT